MAENPIVEIALKNQKWLQDEYGWYWVAELWMNDRRVGLVGNYYALDERLDKKPDVTIL